MFRYGVRVVSDSRVYVFRSNIMQTYILEGQPRGHPVCWCPSWLVWKELELSVPFDRVLGLEFFHKLNRIVVCDNLFFMRAKILRQNMQQGVLGLLKEYAFDVLNLSHLEAYILPINVRSIRVIEKSGFYKTESVYKANTPTNASVSHLIYKIQPEAL